MDQEYIDPVLSVIGKDDFNPKSIQSLTTKFPSYYSKITSNCSIALKIYKSLLNLEYELNSWEFLTLKTSININFNFDSNTNTRNFDIKIAKKVIEKCNFIDDEINKLNFKIKIVINFISGLTIQEYISDPGTLLLKIYFKLLNLKNSILEKISISFTKSKLLIINFELKQITNMIESQENPLVGIDTNFQATLESYKDFVTILINQLDNAVNEKDTDQIQECLGILNDVESMYDSVRMNFFYTEELNEWEQEQQLLLQEKELEESFSNSSPSPSPQTIFNGDFSEDSIEESNQYSKFSNLHSSQELPNHHHHHLSRRGSISSTSSSIATFNSRQPTTITEELPYLLQAFDEAKQLEQELSTYQQQPLSRSSSTIRAKSPPNSSSKLLNKYDQRKSNLQTLNIPNVGFNNNLLNSIYGLSPKNNNSNNTPTIHHQSNLHNEVD